MASQTFHRLLPSQTLHYESRPIGLTSTYQLAFGGQFQTLYCYCYHAQMKNNPIGIGSSYQVPPNQLAWVGTRVDVGQSPRFQSQGRLDP